MPKYMVSDCMVCKEEVSGDNLLCDACNADYLAHLRQPYSLMSWVERRKRELATKELEEVLDE